ncbi:MAG: 3-methylornithyl-N6-L-lysine dehydrogenase PylD [Lachnospiraceae bacterium]|nr:3-methylornithyl-N6-L-lysine dehydrogenase PylD [Lachnospiraceae bacterium]
MSRLIESDIEKVAERMALSDQEFKKQTGCTMEETAQYAVGLKNRRTHYRTAVVPVTSGLGIIGGFSDTVCEILKYCGIDAWVTQKTDVAGLQEAYEKNAEMVFMADDDIFSAFLLDGRRIYSDNGYGTGIGYAAALSLAMKGKKEEVLVLGAGPVGRAAAGWFDLNQIPFSVYDVVEERAIEAVKGLPYGKVLESGRKKKEFHYFLDATPVEGVITKNDVAAGTVIASPGMPIGTTKEAQKEAVLIFNPLESGVLTMYYDCMKQDIG